jgi:ElaB/YqjD/DUF883 family membrane-anchored ribosome-binding protein
MGVDTAQALTASLGKSIDTADSQKALDAIRLQIEEVRKNLGDKVADGLLDQATQKANDLTDALDKATPGINSVREAMKELGITSDETLTNTANKSKEAYDTLKDSGMASVRELQDAFKKMAEDQLAAAGQVGSSQYEVTKAILESEAAIRGLSVAFDDNGKMVVGKQGDAKTAIEKTTGAIEDQITALERENKAIERTNAAREKAIELENKRLKIDSSGMSVDGSGKRIEISNPTDRSVFENAKSQGLSDEQAKAIMNQFMQNGTQIGWQGASGMNADGTPTGDNWSTLVQKAIDKVVLANVGSGKKIPLLASGTNYIPYDEFPAILHKGEAVVPAEYNPAAGSTSPESRNNYLKSEIDRLLAIQATFAAHATEVSDSYTKGIRDSTEHAKRITDMQTSHVEAGTKHQIELTINGKSTAVNVASESDALALINALKRAQQTAGL